MSLYIFQTLNGLGMGMIYFLIAVGLSIIFGMMNFVNFAHGAFYITGAYLCFQFTRWTDNFWFGLFAGPIAVAGTAYLLEQMFFRHLYRKPHITQILVMLGVALIIQEIIVIVWGPIGSSVTPPQALRGFIELGQFSYPAYRLFVVIFSSTLALFLWLLLERTKYGAVLRAGTESSETVSLLGLNVARVFSFAFVLGAYLAGIGGALAAPIRGVEPFAGDDALGIGFAVVVIGGMGSFAGALVGGLMIGVTQSVMSSIWPEGANIMIYFVMAAIILIFPRGLVGRV